MTYCRDLNDALNIRLRLIDHAWGKQLLTPLDCSSRTFPFLLVHTILPAPYCIKCCHSSECPFQFLIRLTLRKIHDLWKIILRGSAALALSLKAHPHQLQNHQPSADPSPHTSMETPRQPSQSSRWIQRSIVTAVYRQVGSTTKSLSRHLLFQSQSRASYSNALSLETLTRIIAG